MYDEIQFEIRQKLIVLQRATSHEK